MGDMLCAGMGIFDIVAGILIMFGYGFSGFALIFGMIMIIKGGISFI